MLGSEIRSSMKSPADLADRFRRQWSFADTRELRLLHAGVWPISLPIGKPTADEFIRGTARVREHLQRWRMVRAGEVVWAPANYRGGTEPVSVPVAWRLHSAAEWVAAIGDAAVKQEYEGLQRILRAVDPAFRVIVVRQRSFLRDKPEEDIVRAAAVAMRLAPGCAAGRPLRALSELGIDTKFFERNRGLMVEFLDARFDGQASELGLEGFLGAVNEDKHWILVVPLGPGMLPFEQQRVRSSELLSTPLPCSHVLIVENESSLHQLPTLADTIAVMGCGLDLEWVQADWLRRKRVGYWGDLDTWGLQMLARARLYQPHMTALLMSAEIFDAYSPGSGVAETGRASEVVPRTLTTAEQVLYARLRADERGRLEQEFLPANVVRAALVQWRRSDHVTMEPDFT
jgi:hypothetical protein